MLDILIFAILAIVLFIKLKNIIGKENENTTQIKNKYISKIKLKNVSNKASNGSTSNHSQGIEVKEQKVINVEELIQQNLALIKPELKEDYKKLSSFMPVGFFDVQNFINGVETLFAELIKARSEHNIDPLKNELSPSLFKQLKSNFEAEKLNNPNQKTDLLKISDLTIESINVNADGGAKLKVKLSSEQFRYTLDGENVKSGSTSIPKNFIDFLVFERSVKNKIYFWVLKSIE